MASHNKSKAEHRLFLQFFSIMLAITLWIIINYTEDPIIDATISDIKIEYRGLDTLTQQGLTIPNSFKQQILTVSATGKRSDLIQIIRKAKAYVNVSDIKDAGTYTLEVQTELPVDNVSVSKEKNKTLDVTVDRIVSKKIPVVVKQTDKNKDFLVKSIAQQESITLTGPETMMSNVSSVLVAVSTINMKEDNTQEYSYRIMNSNNSEVDYKENFTADTDVIKIYNELYTPTALALSLTIPESVSSLYDIDLIQAPTITVGTRAGAPDKLSVVFPENTIKAPGIDEYTLSIVNNEYIYIPDNSTTIEVEAEITKKQLQYVQLPVRFKNVDPHYTASSEVTAIDTYINCVPENLTNTSLVAYADMSGYTEGTHEIVLSYDNTDDIKVIGEYRIKVKLSKNN